MSANCKGLITFFGGGGAELIKEEKTCSRGTKVRAGWRQHGRMGVGLVEGRSIPAATEDLI